MTSESLSHALTNVVSVGTQKWSFQSSLTEDLYEETIGIHTPIQKNIGLVKLTEANEILFDFP